MGCFLKEVAVKHGNGLIANQLSASHVSCAWAVRACAVGVLLLATLAACGCASFGGSAASTNLATAREFSLRGLDEVQKGNLERAERLFGDAVDVCPQDERARRHLAEVLWQRGEVDDAIAHMEHAVRLSAGDPKLLVHLGEMHLSRGDLDRAEQLADDAIRRNRQLAAAWALQGDVSRRRGDDQEALASYHRSLGFREHYPRVQLAVAELYQRTGRTQRSLATLIALADQYPPGQAPQAVFVQRGLALKTLGRYIEAVEVFESAARRGPATADVLYQLAETRLLTGDDTNAQLAVRAALAADPQHRASRQLSDQLIERQKAMTAGLERQTSGG